MNQESLKDRMRVCIADLLHLADIHCWNTVSPNVFFILSDYNEFEGENFNELKSSRNRVNNSKIALTLDSAVEILNREYEDLYDINLYIFRASKKETVIEIQYYRKSNFQGDYFSSIKDNLPMYHSKITMPEYTEKGEKFDINWESGRGIHHVWKKVLYRCSRKGKFRKS